MAVNNHTYGQTDEVRTLRGSFRMMVAVQFIVFVTLFTLRFDFAGSVVNANANVWVGALETLLVLLAAYAGGWSLRSARQGNAASYERYSWFASFFGFASVLLMVFQWRSLGLDVSNHYAEAYYMVTGFWMLYALVGALLYWAMRARNRRIPFTAENHWDAEAVTTFGVVPLIAWIAIFVIMYFA